MSDKVNYYDHQKCGNFPCNWKKIFETAFTISFGEIRASLYFWGVVLNWIYYLDSYNREFHIARASNLFSNFSRKPNHD